MHPSRMESLLIVRTVFALLYTTTMISGSSLQQTNNQQVNSPSTKDATQNENYFLYQRSEYPKDCRDVQSQCSTTNSSGIYVIKPYGIQEPFEVFCNNDVDTGGWTVIQRRETGYVNFNRSWSQYEEGFGFLSTEFWLGNEKLSYLTNQAVYELRVDLQLSDGSWFYTTYKGFRINDGFGQYNLWWVGTLESNAGSFISACQTNRKYGTCNCETTCEDPNGESGCHGNCLGNEGCICPDGFAMQGNDCIHTNECGCYVREANLVIPDGETYVTDDCIRRCSCNNNLLNCVDITCSTNAACVISNGVRQCSCNEGYDGDGQTCETLYTDCKDVYDAGNIHDGVYTILPSGWTDEQFCVYCKMDNGGGWTVFQRRIDRSTNFYRNWTEYKQGFGDIFSLNGDFWLGNDKLYFLTNQRNYKLRFDVTTSSGSPKYAEYSEFQIESESTNYKMNQLGSHSGNTGYLSVSRGRQFSTPGRANDNDACDNVHCAEKHRSGWWHSDHWCSTCYGSNCWTFLKSGSCHALCTDDNLNGDYNGGNGQNIYSDIYYFYNFCNLRSVEMKIRPTS